MGSLFKDRNWLIPVIIGIDYRGQGDPWSAVCLPENQGASDAVRLPQNRTEVLW